MTDTSDNCCDGLHVADATDVGYPVIELHENSSIGAERAVPVGSDSRNDAKDHSTWTQTDTPELHGIEDLDKYRQGGYHPVHLGDEFQDGRYRVLHKLGYGGFSTVWLARDTEAMTLVALKIMVALASNEKERNEIRIWTHLKQRDTKNTARRHLCMLLSSFQINGPNGTHSCLIYPVTGLNVGGLSSINMRLRSSVVRIIARQLIETLAYLHSEGVCHGDLTASNITLKLADFENWTDADLETRLGSAETEKLMTSFQDTVPNRCPRYVVKPVDLSRIDPNVHTQDIALIDFGEAFLIDDPPSHLGTPEPYRSPSLWFGELPGTDSDLWALGCTLFHMRSGRDLIYSALVALGPSGSIREIINYLGPLPDRWNKMYFDLYGIARPRDEINSKIQRYYEDEYEENLLDPWETAPAEEPLRAISLLIPDNYHGPVRSEDEKSAARLGADWRPHWAMVKIPREEGLAFGDMLERLLCYEPKEQTPAAALLEHPWLTSSFPENTRAGDATPLFQSNYPSYA